MCPLYPTHCIHNNPIGHPFCPGCMDDRSKLQQERYNQYCRSKHKSFDPFGMFGSNEESEFQDDEEEDDMFQPLRKSNSQEELRRAYHKLARQLHPDKPQGSTLHFQELQKVYENNRFFK